MVYNIFISLSKLSQSQAKSKNLFTMSIIGWEKATMSFSYIITSAATNYVEGRLKMVGWWLGSHLLLS
jgi:hypothetical protein